MYLPSKHFHPINFTFAGRRRGRHLSLGSRTLLLETVSSDDGIHHITVSDPANVQEDGRLARPYLLDRRASGAVHSRLEIDGRAGMRLLSAAGEVLLQGTGGRWFGMCGSCWLFQFDRTSDMLFYGLGEKQMPFVRPDRAYSFWNVDVWADHGMEQARDDDYDPDYISIPYLIIKRGNTYIGLLCDTAHAAMISLSSEAQVAEQLQITLDYPAAVVLGAEDGQASLYCIVGPSLAELTRKLQILTGTTPLPPLWALGYQQSRWGYRGEADLRRLAERFTSLEFPVDGLWLDIDYMDGFRVFTLARGCLPDAAATVADLRRMGMRVVPILDPGVKCDDGYAVYSEGCRQGVFCLTAEGRPFVGMVWPGFTVFPDFSLERVRRWWAELARDFFDIGFEGAWIDMNDPSTGPVDPMAMRFQEGRSAHGCYRNQYALLMAKATMDGLLASRPDQRPFLLSRSGSTGAQKYAAHWTGDNFSNYRHLRRSIGKSLNLALSGMPFNGADVGGFGDDCGEELLIDWFKAAFLFPFLRNHTMRGSRDQEPWAYSAEAMRIIRHYVRLRYRLMPYLYNLFIDQEERGEAILRPLFYDFADSDALPLAAIDDQFMVGPAIMQAPFVDERGDGRTVVLPPGKWLEAESGRWRAGGGTMSVARKPWATPLYLRHGSLIPFAPGSRVDNRHDLNRIGLFCCLDRHFTGTARLVHRADDGLSFGYRRGERSAVEIDGWVVDEVLHLNVNVLQRGYGDIAVTPYTSEPFAAVLLQDESGTRTLQPEADQVRICGERLNWQRWR